MIYKCKEGTLDSITHLNFNTQYSHLQMQQIELIRELETRGVFQKIIVHNKNIEFIKKVNSIEKLEVIESSKPHLFSMYNILDSKIVIANDSASLRCAFWGYVVFNIPYIMIKFDESPLKKTFIQNIYYKFSKSIIATSEFIADDILNLYSIDEKDITIIPYTYTKFTIDEEYMASLKEQYEQNYIIGTIAPFTQNFDYKALIDVARKFKTLHPLVQFIFIGDGVKKQAMVQYASGLENITFLPEDDHIYEYISLFDIFIYPVKTQGFCPILLDVMRQNKIILTTNVGSIPNIIRHNYNGVYLPSFNTQDIIDTIESVRCNKDFRDTLQHNETTVLLEHSPEIVTNQYLKVMFE